MPRKHTKEYAYEMGKDYAVNGANTTNCNFAIFSSKENTRAWEEGKKMGSEVVKWTSQN